MTTTYPTVDDYKEYDLVQHVFERPDMYIGADAPVSTEMYVYNLDTEKMELRTLDIIPGVERLQLEVISNAADNAFRSYIQGIHPGKIIADIEKKRISIKNEGLPVPIEKNKNGVYIPESIFGKLLTGSNLEGDSIVGGRNGVGAKAANIYSTTFSIYLTDHVRKLSYQQTWENHMSVKHPAKIEPYKGKTSSVEVSYEMDFERFKLPVSTKGGYPDHYVALFYKHMLDASFTSKVPVVINGKEYDFSDIKDYAAIYFDELEVKTSVVHKHYSPEYTSKVFKNQKYNNLFPILEYIVLDTPEEGKAVSFANGISTKKGGVHVEATIKAIGDKLLPVVNDTITKKLLKTLKVKELDAKTKRMNLATLGHIKEHVSVLLSARVVAPRFDAQTKLTLEYPTPQFTIQDSFVKSVKDWQLLARLYAAIEQKQQNAMKKMDGKLKKHVDVPDLMDANFAGGPKRDQCVAIFEEGKSAKSYVEKYINLHENGKDWYGTYPLGGKMMNVMDDNVLNSDTKVKNNRVFNDIHHVLGLKHNTDYSSDAAFKTLRYGKVIIMTDADVDGNHILSLFLNFFHCKYPALLERGYVWYYRTPIVRVWNKQDVINFYSMKDYEDWSNMTPGYEKWKHKYYKGLGTSQNADVIDHFLDEKLIKLNYDKHAAETLKLAFHKTLADNRKDWIGKFDAQNALGYHGQENENISDFINNELVLYSIDNIERSIPNVMDGLKTCQRKITYGAIQKFKPSEVKRVNDYEEYKVGRFAMYVAETTLYQHGEAALCEAIIKMAQDFPGANNLSLFSQDGQFGSRYHGGTNAAHPRYINTRPETLFPFIIRREDTPILDFLTEEGECIEPKTFYPIIPLVLINGANGIATGYSTCVQSHNPKDVIDWYITKLEGKEEPKSIIPWYRGYKGTIQVFDRRTKTKRGRKDAQEDENSRTLMSMTTTGDFYTQKDGTVVITELPIGTWPYKYKEWLEKLIQSKQISEYRDLSGGDDTGENVYFELYNYKGAPSYKSLKLEKTIGMSNMVLLDEENHPVRFDTTDDILDSFYKRRLK